MPERNQKTVSIRDVTLRDGLQSLKTILPTPSKIKIYDALVNSGINQLQITSFVNPARVPQLGDAEDLFAAVRKRPERKSILVANLRGFERAVAAEVSEVEAVVSLSNSYNTRNAHRTTRQSMDETLEMLRRASEYSVEVTVAVANCYHCMFEGRMPPSATLDAIAELHKNGVKDVFICDTTGYGTPDQIYDLSVQAKQSFPDVTFGTHLHDTRGRGLANAIAALNAGVTWFDAALAGLGGSPFAPGMGGNLSLETLSDTFQEMGVVTGIDVQKVLGVGQLVRELVTAAENAQVETARASN